METELAVEAAAKSRDLLCYSGWESYRNWTRKRKQKDHLVWLAGLARILAGEENFSAEEKGNRYFQFPVTPLLPHAYPHSNQPPGTNRFQFTKNPHSFSLSNSFYTCLYFKIALFSCFSSLWLLNNKNTNIPKIFAIYLQLGDNQDKRYAVFWSSYPNSSNCEEAFPFSVIQNHSLET